MALSQHLHPSLTPDMFARLALVSLCALAVAASPTVVRDSPIVSLPIARRFNLTGSSKLIELDRARVKSLKGVTPGSNSKKTKFQTLFDVSSTNAAVDYTATVCYWLLSFRGARSLF